MGGNVDRVIPRMATLRSAIVRGGIVFLLFAVFFPISAMAQEVSVEVVPVPALAGEQAQLKIISQEGDPKLLEQPGIPGIKWMPGRSTSMESQIINYKASTKYIAIYFFTPEKEGKIRFPALKVQVGNKKIAANPFDLLVISRKFSARPGGGGKQQDSQQKQGKDKQLKLEDIVFIRASPLVSKPEVYVGEEIPFEIRLYSLNGLNVKCGWPDIQLENAVFKDYSRLNGENPKFAIPFNAREDIDGSTFNTTVFRTAFRIIAPGKVSGKVLVQTVLMIPKDRNSGNRPRDPFNDPFSDDFSLFSPFGAGYDTLKPQLSADIGEIDVKPLPAPEPDSNFLGLVGEWKIDPELSPDTDKVKTGETLTLSLKVRGDGTTETLKAPELKVDGFRIYPPEIDKDKSMPDGTTCTVIRYVLIPVEPGTASVNFNFSSFSPRDGKYSTIPFNRKFKIEKSDEVSSQQIISDTGPAAGTGQKAVEKPKRKNELLNPKTGKGSCVKVPLWGNHIAATGVFFALGILIPLLSEIMLLWRERLVRDPLLRRRLEARRRKGAVMRELRAASADGIHVAVRNHVLPYMNDILGTPPGTSAGELSEHIEDKELAQCLCDAESSSYMPGAVSPSELKDRLIKALGRFSLIAVSMSVLCAAAISAETPKKAEAAKAGPTDPLTCYYNGDFATAAGLLRKEINPSKPNPVLLYNLGDCLYQTGDLPKALVCFERALRLSPRDSDIKENLNLIRRQLMLPELGRSETPADAFMNIRDMLRPDEWLLASSVFFLAAGIFLALRRRFASGGWIGFASASLFMSLLCAAASFSQSQTSYSSENAFIVERNISPHLLPSENSNRASFKFNGGEELKVLEDRNGWLRVRAGSVEGWVEADSIEKLFP